MTVHVGQWIGLGGVAPDDNRTAHAWEKRLDGIMIAIALLSLPVALADTGDFPPWVNAAVGSLAWIILLAFTLELVWMMHVSSRRAAYLARNWLNVVIIVFAALGLFGLVSGVWVASARAARLALVALLLARAISAFGGSLVARGVPLVFGLAFLISLLAGVGFYIL